MAKAEDFMWDLFSIYAEELQNNGCLEIDNIRAPSLTNEIHGIFALDRWMKGHEQRTEKFYHRMKPSLQLASKMITEDCALPWFHHLTWGEIVSDPGKKSSYIVSSRREHTKEGQRETKRRLNELADMITWEFTPRKYRKVEDYGSWGVTTNDDWPCWPWGREYKSSDYPILPSKYYEPDYDRRVPTVTLLSDFQDFFYEKYRVATPSERYRAWYMFASTLVHELAHAYFMYLGRARSQRFKDEPRWYKHEGTSELGYSWENITLGRICNPQKNKSQGFWRSCLCSISAKKWEGSDEQYQYKIFKKTIGNPDGLQLQRIPLVSGHLWDPDSSWRGSQFFYGEYEPANVSTLTVIHAIPMSWITGWFSESDWQKKRKLWKDERDYSPPSLGPTFIAIYYKDNWGNAQLYIATKQSIDPNLDDVQSQVTVMGLYDDEIPF